MKQQTVLEVRHLTKGYGQNIVLKDISFSVPKGSIVGLLGKNGAGKTTLMKTILGLLCQYDGEIYFDGNKMNCQSAVVMSRIGSLVDVRFYDDMTAYQNLNYLLLADPHMTGTMRRQRISELLEMVGLEKNRNDKVRSFSLGMKQRLALAQVFVHEAGLLILDEPFIGLDPVGMEEMKYFLKEMQRQKNVSIIFSSHQLDEVGDLADEIVAISDGTVKYCGTLKELQNRNKKYKIWFKGKELPVVIPYDEEKLQDTISEHSSKGFAVEKIEVLENALYQLFV